MKKKIYLIIAVHHQTTRIEKIVVLAESNYKNAEKTCKKFNEEAKNEKSNYHSVFYIIEECNLYDE